MDVVEKIAAVPLTAKRPKRASTFCDEGGTEIAIYLMRTTWDELLCRRPLKLVRVERDSPSRRRWTRPKENAVASSVERTVVANTFIPNGFDNRWRATTVCAAKERTISLWRSHPSFAKEGNARTRRLTILDSTTLTARLREGGDFPIP
jgi:hypothetical protein